MQNKQIEVDCPCCSSRLTVDVLTRTVMRALPPEESDASGRPIVPEERWEGARGKVSERQTGAVDRMDAALEAEKNKASRLDDLFDQAKAKIEKRREEQDDSL